MTVSLCGARYRHNRAITCGKPPGHLSSDPLHKMSPDDPASIEWFDYDTADRETRTTPDLFGALQNAVNRARAARLRGGGTRG